MMKHFLLAAALACLVGAGAYLILDDPDVVTVDAPESLAFEDDEQTTPVASVAELDSGSSTSTVAATTSTAVPSTAPSTTTPSTTPTTPPTTPPTTTTVAPTPTPTPTTTAAPAPPSTTTAAPATTAPPSGNKIQQAATKSLAQLNATRASVGLDPLSIDPAMSTFAVDWSREMIATNFEHSSGPYAENIAWHSNGNMSPQAAAQHFNQAWVNSPGHYANMTNSRWTHVGIGLVSHASGWWATHVFR